MGIGETPVDPVGRAADPLTYKVGASTYTETYAPAYKINAPTCAKAYGARGPAVLDGFTCAFVGRIMDAASIARGQRGVSPPVCRRPSNSPIPALTDRFIDRAPGRSGITTRASAAA